MQMQQTICGVEGAERDDKHGGGKGKEAPVLLFFCLKSTITFFNPSLQGRCQSRGMMTRKWKGTSTAGRRGRKVASVATTPN